MAEHRPTPIWPVARPALLKRRIRPPSAGLIRAGSPVNTRPASIDGVTASGAGGDTVERRRRRLRGRGRLGRRGGPRPAGPRLLPPARSHPRPPTLGPRRLGGSAAAERPGRCSIGNPPAAPGRSAGAPSPTSDRVGDGDAACSEPPAEVKPPGRPRSGGGVGGGGDGDPARRPPAAAASPTRSGRPLSGGSPAGLSDRRAAGSSDCGRRAGEGSGAPNSPCAAPGGAFEPPCRAPGGASSSPSAAAAGAFTSSGVACRSVMSPETAGG